MILGYLKLRLQCLIMSDDTTEDHWKRRCEKLEEEVVKKDKKIDELEERVNRLEGLLTNAINQIKTITLELNSAKETAAAANARIINAKADKKKDKKNTRNLQASTNESAENAPQI